MKTSVWDSVGRKGGWGKQNYFFPLPEKITEQGAAHK